jgi:hypothetical protein
MSALHNAFGKKRIQPKGYALYVCHVVSCFDCLAVHIALSRAALKATALGHGVLGQDSGNVTRVTWRQYNQMFGIIIMRAGAGVVQCMGMR